MGLGGLVRTIGKIGKTFGQINQGAKKFGTIVQAGRKFGSIVNEASGGKIAQSKFGRDISKLADKADMITEKVVTGSDKIQNAVQKINLS